MSVREVSEEAVGVLLELANEYEGILEDAWDLVIQYRVAESRLERGGGVELLDIDPSLWSELSARFDALSRTLRECRAFTTVLEEAIRKAVGKEVRKQVLDEELATYLLSEMRDCVEGIHELMLAAREVVGKMLDVARGTVAEDVVADERRRVEAAVHLADDCVRLVDEVMRDVGVA